MKRFNIYITILLIAISSCKKGEIISPLIDDDNASFEITFNTPTYATETKNSTLTPPESNWEKAVDGSYIYNFTLFLVRESDRKLVAYRNFVLGENSSTNTIDANNYALGNGISPDGQRVKVKFDYLNPLHKDNSGSSSEKLRRDKYRAIMFANYRETTLNGSTYNGLYGEENTSLASIVDNIITSFNNNVSTGLLNFRASNDTYRPFYFFRVDIGEGNLCKKEPQMLESVMVLDLLSGNNQISATMERTRVRVKVVVTNKSSSKILSVKGLSLNYFTQDKAYIFKDPDNEDFIYSNTPIPKRPLVYSDNAIVPFTASEDAPIDIPTRSSVTIFDGYMHESRLNNYEYSVHLDYNDNSYIKYIKEYNTPITTLTGLQYAHDISPYFIIQNAHNGVILKNDNNGSDILGYINAIDISDIATNISNNQIIFRLDKLNSSSTDYNYYLFSIGGDRWVSNINPSALSNNILLVETTNDKGVYTIEQKRDLNLKNNNNYLDFYNNGVRAWSSVSLTGESGGRWIFYNVQTKSGAVFNDDLTFTRINPITHHNEKVTEIKRNQYYTINISAAYEKIDGHTYFEVLDWEPKIGEITFD